MDRDLCAFCANASDGINTARPALKGKNIRDIKDKDEKALGEEMLKCHGGQGPGSELEVS
jgi:hypothetical protein